MRAGQDTGNRNPFGFDDVEPSPRRSGLPWLLGALVVLVGAGVGAYFLFFSGPGPARPTVQRVVDKVNAGEFGTLGGDLCAANRSELQRQLDMLEAGEFDLRLGEVTSSGDTARAELAGTYSIRGVSQQVDQTLGLTLEDGRWKVCDLAE